MPCSRPDHPDHKASRGFTLVELLIVIGVIVVLIALLLPSVAAVRARARSAECQSNLTQLGLALNAANRNRSTPVNSNSWAADIAPFLDGESGELFVCPTDLQAENRTADEQDPTNTQFKGSFGANNQMHRKCVRQSLQAWEMQGVLFLSQSCSTLWKMMPLSRDRRLPLRWAS
jgi:prepilin-type N-terminal cleavage/methylation domain-containing protein